MDKVHKMLELARVTSDDTVFDLGCGDGRVLITAAKIYGAHAVGIEIDPLRFLFAWLMVLASGQSRRVKIMFGNFFTKEIGGATVIVLFLYGPTNNRLKEKLRRELRPGTRIVSYVWEFEGWQMADSLPEDTIYMYVI
ncbi:MAG: class I SAM-dependent methyltransferase [candidate division WOR-3 bacterium]|nr:MAG: class I SAM-dependent methyltransferase [candidate division WOR-3 bacterium]